MEQIRYRHEYKYPLTKGQVLIEDAKIRALMSRDAHAAKKGFYNIRSLYFDDYENTCYMDNENGVDNREKYRIRIYDHNPERISLEAKQKIRGMTCKKSCLLSLEQCIQLMHGQIPDRIGPA